MKSMTWYQWEESDLPVAFIEEACFRLKAFYEDSDVPLHKSAKRVLGGNFTLTDVQSTAKLLESLASRAEAKWQVVFSPSETLLLMREEVLAAAANARESVDRLWNIFRGTA
jgi:hypothetical protein